MSSFKTFAIAGVGNVGVHIAEELLKKQQAGVVTDLVILSRSSSKNESAEKLVSQGARIASVDYTSEASLISALQGIDVVISTVSHHQLDIQPLLTFAAKEAGVRLFVPSEFGNPSDDAEGGLLMAKKQVQLKLKELDLPYLLAFTGPSPGFVLSPEFHVDFENGKATVGGDGNALISFTSMPDMGSFLAYVLTTLPPDQLNWRILRIEGERISFSEIFRQYTAKTGKKIVVTYQTLNELEAVLEANPHDFPSYIHWTWAQGGGVVGKPEELTNGLYPDWNPKKVIDVIAP
ncbi:NAD-P-binding protein [Dentipellis sp. KUC8613]|nr:NAD-P-binding protein [Dentipellis sp. KUC8613]